MNSKYVFKVPVKIYRMYYIYTYVTLEYQENPFADKFTTAVLSSHDYPNLRAMLEVGLNSLNRAVKEHPNTVYTLYRLKDRK